MKNARLEHTSLSHGEILELRRWNTPTIYNGWEQITKHNSAKECFNLEETMDFMPQMGVMVGRAVTVVCEPGNSRHPKNNLNAWSEYRRYIANISGPKIVVVQDLDKPNVFGAFWGEVNANIHRAFDCVGTITDGGIRDVDEMAFAGFKAIGKRLCVGHAYSCPVSWGEQVEVFGIKVQPDQLIHADKHGFIVIPPDDEKKLLEASRFMDSNECHNMISVSREMAGKSIDEKLKSIDDSVKRFGEQCQQKFGRNGEF